MKPNKKNLIWIAPLAILGMLLFAFIGGEIVMRLWNWLAPDLFGLRTITFWQAFGLLVLCRILFGGFGMSGSGRHRSSRSAGDRIADRVAERVAERMEQMTPEERDRLRQTLHDRSKQTSPLDSTPGV